MIAASRPKKSKPVNVKVINVWTQMRQTEQTPMIAARLMLCALNGCADRYCLYFDGSITLAICGQDKNARMRATTVMNHRESTGNGVMDKTTKKASSGPAWIAK